MSFIHIVPGLPENFTVQVLNYTTVRLTWLPPSSPNGVILFYNITYYGTRLHIQSVSRNFNSNTSLFATGSPV